MRRSDKSTDAFEAFPAPRHRAQRAPPLPVDCCVCRLRCADAAGNSPRKGIDVNQFNGSIRWFSAGKGIGMIVPDDGGQDVFAHFSQILDTPDQILAGNQRVSFCIAPQGAGRHAVDIRPCRTWIDRADRLV